MAESVLRFIFQVIARTLCEYSVKLLKKLVGVRAAMRGGRSVVRHSWIVRVIVFLSVGGFAAFFAMACEPVIGFQFAAVVGMPMFLHYFLYRVEFDSESLYIRSVWRRRRIIPWKDVLCYSYSTRLSCHVFDTRRHGNVYLGRYLAGLGTLWDEAEMHGIPIPFGGKLDMIE